MYIKPTKNMTHSSKQKPCKRVSIGINLRTGKLKKGYKYVDGKPKKVKPKK